MQLSYWYGTTELLATNWWQTEMKHSIASVNVVLFMHGKLEQEQEATAANSATQVVLTLVSSCPASQVKEANSPDVATEHCVYSCSGRVPDGCS
jgi:hypothetical protein